ncbi:prepilin-type N-terminal cleavage/methylation domain-containing protein [Candidatus Dojkabacteria bacterium]|uniref:Prepilin-type N-terminal cleavage/methylation domain-containing protein n=1 Tax=Candidatus Dojkabacteria bacterium TaxID=2099670 RepID=A0A955L778_9BACT|nr:prepilin-type N-terminal cleavage/methylation domain-containing protein [Candidatus Dojkabacteria bacterium]
MKNKKGFSLVELLVAMAIIAVLIAIAAFGIQILQRNARNTQRRKSLQDVQLVIADITANYFGETPNGAFTISGTDLQIPHTSGPSTYPIPAAFANATAGLTCGTAAGTTTATGGGALGNDEIVYGIDTTSGTLCVSLEAANGGDYLIYTITY